jgi:hypothetical protein
MSAVIFSAALATLMLVTTGCSASLNGSGEKDGSSNSSDSAASGQQKDVGDNGAISAGIDPMKPPKPITSFTAPAPYEKDPAATARFDIYSIRRQGKLAILTLSVTPTFSTVDSPSLYSLMGSHSLAPTLIDPVNLREYKVVSSGSGNLSSNDMSAKTLSGKPMFLWAAFAAPPTNVSRVTLNLYDTLPGITGVPVQ